MDDKKLRQLDQLANPNPFGVLCAHGTPKEEPCEGCTEEDEALYCDHGELVVDCSECYDENKEYIAALATHEPLRDNEGLRCNCEDAGCCEHS